MSRARTERKWRVGRLGLFLLLIVLLGGAVACREPVGTPAPPADIRFTNVAADVGLDFRHGAFRWELSDDTVAMMGGGLCWIDYDRDGWLDLYVVNSYAVAEAGRWETETGELPRSTLFRNKEGQFDDVGRQTGTGLAMRGNGCVAADFDLDGWTDLYVTTAAVNHLLWNNGDGTFSEGAEAAGVDAYGWQTATAVGDVDGNGWPDLFVAGYVDLNSLRPDATMAFPNNHDGLRDLLYLSNGPGPDGHVTFREVGKEIGLERGEYEYGLGALLSDVDRDGDLDLFVANDTNPNRLYVNDPYPGGALLDPAGIGIRFSEAGEPANVNDTNSGIGVAGGDFDEDGRIDLFITTLGRQTHSVYRNESTVYRPVFADARPTLGVEGLGVGWTGWGTSWIDYDLDSDLDLLVINGSVPVTDLEVDRQIPHLYGNLTAQGRPGEFELLTVAAGLEQVGPLLGRGSAAADFDNDGDMDVAAITIGGPLVLLRNDGARGNWLTVTLPDAHPGAVVTAVLPDGRILEREMHTGSSYLASEDPRCHFGLGETDRVAEIHVRWPDGRETRLTDVAANQFVAVRTTADG